MRNNHFIKTQILLAAFAAAVIAPICAFSQQRTGTSRPVIKDSDIYVPNKVLEPSITDKEAKEMLKDYIEIFDASQMPKTYDAYLLQEDKNNRIGTRQFQTALNNLSNFIFDATAKPDEKGRYPVSLELQEVTGYSDAWYSALYEKADAMSKSAKDVDKAVRTKNAALFAQACKDYSRLYDDLEKYRKAPKKLSATRLKQITDSNREKRRRDYIAQRKKQMMEEYEAQRAAEEALNRAAGASRKK